ncbi:MAG: DUF3108 domain-containing protein [Burkholderiaceae bacterium]|nr:DUF3108 domain-containing protein [Burkholderiaceae bacterium]
MTALPASPQPAPAPPWREPDPPAAAVAPRARPSPLAAAPSAAADAGSDAFAEAAADAAAAAHPVGADEAAGAPPPVYATRIPPPLQLRYALRYNGRSGEATLAWRHDGRQYTLALDGRDASQTLVAQASQGGFDAAGLAPERFTDRRRGGRLQAANFRRDIGRIAFSGPAVDHPAWPGAQDRLSWLPQFVAIRAAAADAASLPADIRLFVVDARGAGGLWSFRRDGDETLDTPQGPLAAERWRREPPRPEGLRVEAWLDAGRGHWPVALRFTALRSGDVFELRLRDEPTAPP